MARADLLLQPDATDISGQIVLDAQSLGVPCLVSAASAAREFMDHDVTGLVLPAADTAAWAEAILSLLGDEPRRQRMARTARQRAQRFNATNAYDAVWQACLQAAQARESSPPANAKPADAVQKEIPCG
jgi:glycosyltransferase involved in cell wall biosynthesis